MANDSLIHWFKNISIAKKLYSVVGVMAILIAVELGTLYFAVSTLSSVRALINAEGLWSKSQKDAVYNLRKYHRTRNAEDEKAFYRFMEVPQGYHKTLVELQKENPDLAVARQGLIEGGNHPQDIDGMLKLFIRFDNISYIKRSMQTWAKADSIIGGLVPIAKKLRTEIERTAAIGGILSGENDVTNQRQKKLDDIINQADPINQKLTALENEFSHTLGEGARWMENSILKLLLAIALTVEFSGLILTYFIARGITKGLKAVTDASERVAKKDFCAKAQVFSNDEIGKLADSFNHMIAELEISNARRAEADEELASKINFIKENEKRVVSIMNALIKTTQLDFSEKLTLSDRGDELDAIAVGLNTMSEELEFHLHQLKESENKLNEAQRLAKIGSWTMDFATQKVQWSEEMFNIYGYGKERFPVTFGKAMDRVLPEDVELTEARMQKNVENALKLFKTAGIQEYEIPQAAFTVVLNDSSRKVVQGRGKIMLDSKGELIKMVGTVQDIDEQYKAEQKLNEYNLELKRRNKEIQQFAYAASHDLQEPLRSISNFSKLLSERLANYPDKEMHEYMSLVIGGASRMSKLIFSLLEYSRIGKDMQKRATDCDGLIAEILQDLASMIEENNASIHIEKLPVIHSYDLKSVFQNLIINAIKFKKTDIAPVVNISATDLGKEFLFIIKDNGIGIEKEYYDRIFVIFQRLHLRTEYEGTGIGLSLTRKIIEMHGGKIWVESEPGKGTTFYFTIPKS